MSDLQNQTPADTYKGLLQVGDYTDGITNNAGASALQVTDGAGVNTALALSTTRVGVGNSSPQAELDVNGNVVADEYALDQTGSSSSAVAIHAPAPNELAIRANSTEAMRIDPNGNVGVGTSSPNNYTNYIGLTINGSSSGGSFVDFERNGTLEGEIISDPNEFGVGAVQLSGVLTLRSGGNNERMRIDSNGNVGINTVSPSAPLEVASTTGGVIMPRMTTAQRDAISSPTNGEMIYNTTLNKFQGRANGSWVDFH